MGHQLINGLDFKDEVNNCYATIKFGADSYKEQDYLTGEIVKDGKTVCKIQGNYMGFIDFDGENPSPEKGNYLVSDSKRDFTQLFDLIYTAYLIRLRYMIFQKSNCIETVF